MTTSEQKAYEEKVKLAAVEYANNVERRDSDYLSFVDAVRWANKNPPPSVVRLVSDLRKANMALENVERLAMRFSFLNGFHPFTEALTAYEESLE